MSARKKRFGSRRTLANRNNPSEPGQAPPAPQILEDAGSSQPSPVGPTENPGKEAEPGISSGVNVRDSVADFRQHPAEEGVQNMTHEMTLSAVAQPERCVELLQASEHKIAFSHDGERERTIDSQDLSHLLKESGEGQDRSPRAADQLTKALSWQDELLNSSLHVVEEQLPAVPEMSSETSAGNYDRTAKQRDEVSVTHKVPVISVNQVLSEQEPLDTNESNSEETDDKPATSESSLSPLTSSVLDPQCKDPVEYDSEEEAAVSQIPPTVDSCQLQESTPSEHDVTVSNAPATGHDSVKMGGEVNDHGEEVIPESSVGSAQVDEEHIKSLNSDDQPRPSVSHDLSEHLTPTAVSREEPTNIETKYKDLEAYDTLHFVSEDLLQLHDRNSQDENHSDGVNALSENEEQREQFTYSEDKVGHLVDELHALRENRDPVEGISSGKPEDLTLEGASNVEDTADNKAMNIIQEAQNTSLDDLAIGNLVQERLEISEIISVDVQSNVESSMDSPYRTGETKNEIPNLELSQTFERVAESYGALEHNPEAEKDDATLLAENEEDLTSVLSAEDTIVEQCGDEVKSNTCLDGPPHESVSSADVQTDTGDTEPETIEAMADKEVFPRRVENDSSSPTMESQNDGEKAGVAADDSSTEADNPTVNLDDGSHEAASLLEDTSETEANSKTADGKWEHVIEGQIGPSAISESGVNIPDPDVSPLPVHFEMVQDISLSDTFEIVDFTEGHDFATKIVLRGDEKDSVTVSTPSKDERTAQQHLESFPMLDTTLNPEVVFSEVPEDGAQLSETQRVDNRPEREIIDLSEDIDTLAGTLQTDRENIHNSDQSENIMENQPTITHEENREEPNVEATESNSEVNVSDASNTSWDLSRNRRKLGSSRRNKGRQPIKSDDIPAESVSAKDLSHVSDIVDVVGQSPSLTESSPRSVQPESDLREALDTESHMTETLPEPSIFGHDGNVLGSEEPSNTFSNRTGSRRKLGSSRRNKGRQPGKSAVAGPESHDHAPQSLSYCDLSDVSGIANIEEQSTSFTEGSPQLGESDSDVKVMDMRSEEVASESSFLTLQSDNTSLLEAQDDANIAEGYSAKDMKQMGHQEETVVAGEIPPTTDSSEMQETTPPEHSVITSTIIDAQEAHDKKESDLNKGEALTPEEDVLYLVPDSSTKSQVVDEHQVKVSNSSDQSGFLARDLSEQLTPTTGPSQELSHVTEIKASEILHGVSDDFSPPQNQPNKNSSGDYNDQADSANVLFSNEEHRLAMPSEEKVSQASEVQTEASDNQHTDQSPVCVSIDTLEVSGTDTMDTNKFTDAHAEKLPASQADVLDQSEKEDEQTAGNTETQNSEETLFRDVESCSSVQMLQSELNSPLDVQSDGSLLMEVDETTKDGSHDTLDLADQTTKSGNLGDPFKIVDLTESTDFATKMVLSEEKAQAENKSDNATVSTPKETDRTAEQLERFLTLDVSLNPEDVMSEDGAQSPETRRAQDQPEREVTDARGNFDSLVWNQIEPQNTHKSDQGEDIMEPAVTNDKNLEEPSSGEGNVLGEEEPSNTSLDLRRNRRKLGSSRRNKGRQPIKSDDIPAESVSVKDLSHVSDIVDVVGQSPSLTDSSPQLGESESDKNIMVSLSKEATSESTFPTLQSDNTSPADPRTVQPDSDLREALDTSGGNLLETHDSHMTESQPEPSIFGHDVLGSKEPSDASSNRTGSRRKLGSSRRNKGRQPGERNSAGGNDAEAVSHKKQSSDHDGAAAETYIPELQQDDQIHGSAAADGQHGSGVDQHMKEEAALVGESQHLDLTQEQEAFSQDSSESQRKSPDKKKGSDEKPLMVSELFTARQSGLNTSGGEGKPFSESQLVDNSADLSQSGTTLTGHVERLDLKLAEEVSTNCPSIHVTENQQPPVEEENVLDRNMRGMVSGLDHSDSASQGGETSDGMSPVNWDAPVLGDLKDSSAASSQSHKHTLMSDTGHLETTEAGSLGTPEKNSEKSDQKKRKLGSTRRSQLNRKHRGLNTEPDNTQLINVTREDEARETASTDLSKYQKAELLLSDVGEEKQETTDQLIIQDPQPTMQDSLTRDEAFLPDQVTAPSQSVHAGEDRTTEVGVSQPDHWTQNLESSLVSFKPDEDLKLFQENRQTLPVVEERILKLDVQEQETWRQTGSDAADVTDTADTESEDAPNRRRKLGSSRKTLRGPSNQDELSQTQQVESEETEAATHPENVLDKEFTASEPNEENAAVGFSLTADREATTLLTGEESEAAVSRFAPHDLATHSPGGRRRKMGSHRKSHGGLSHQRQTRETSTGGEIETIEEDVEQDPRSKTQVKEIHESTIEELDGANRDGTSQQERNRQRSPREDQRNSSLGSSVGFIGDCYNVVMVGDSSVGKTSFIRRAQSGKFSLEIPPSIGLDTCFWTVIVDGTPVVLQLWDTAGQERFHSITRNVFYKAQAFLLMYDVTSSKSFSNVRYWASCIQEGAVGDVSTLLLGNKCDEAVRQVTTEEGETVATGYNMTFMECSAATGHNVIESLEAIARLVSQKANRREGNVVLNDDTKRKKRSGCC
ncbi:uncharacterized protein LOC128761090 [Synchiropus splendidus]|uniref:uncharacterized protein LOC128761090 n=1 Tax=Synchiropus splendidus TaxID=270530 RepID=UPI00237E56DF|nr:uncharacterized protein LOC128761090 [Synchiropus splendidus]